uniref:G n=1 Tax=Viola verecunda virus 1 TaxID=2793744 RepID=A0A8D9UIX4_9RHAB|nr:TPA_asm: G [Viola verecunda virus 1]
MLISAGTQDPPPSAPTDERSTDTPKSSAPKQTPEQAPADPDVRPERELKDEKMTEMANQLMGIIYHDKPARLLEKPPKGAEANAIINPRNKDTLRKATSPSTIRPVGAVNQGSTKEKEDTEYRESYMPLYACDDVSSAIINLEPLYRGCIRECQMKDPVKVTHVRPVSPKPFEAKLEVIWMSSTQMFDSCHVDILGGEHRTKSAIEYPLSDKEINDILEEVSGHLILNQDMIHGKYPSADCSYWHDTKTESVMTRIRKSHYDMYYAPEIDEYYIHIPSEQVNVLYWDKEYTGYTGTYRWEYKPLPRPCLLKEGGSFLTCLGSAHDGDKLQCVSEGLMFESPYITAFDNGCSCWIHKDARGNQFQLGGEKTMAYGDAIRDKNPNVQSLSEAMTHLEEIMCLAGCGELTWMSVSNNTDVIVDTPVGIWKRASVSGNKAIQCSSMSTGKITLLTPICTMMGIVGIQHIGSASTTYYWDLNKLYASTTAPACLSETMADIAPLMRHQDNGTLTLDTFVGRVELNTRTGESRFLYYNENMKIDKKRWFPNVALEQTPTDDKTDELEIAIMQQMRNLSAEYQASCREAKGPVILQTVGGAVWMLEQDVGTIWDGITHWFWLWKVGALILICWISLYVIVLVLGLVRTLCMIKTVAHVPVNYSRARRH